jgi:hypothetical protein
LRSRSSVFSGKIKRRRYGEEVLGSPLKPGITPVIFIAFLKPDPRRLGG